MSLSRVNAEICGGCESFFHYFHRERNLTLVRAVKEMWPAQSPSPQIIAFNSYSISGRIITRNHSP